MLEILKDFEGVIASYRILLFDQEGENYRAFDGTTRLTGLRSRPSLITSMSLIKALSKLLGRFL